MTCNQCTFQFANVKVARINSVAQTTELYQDIGGYPSPTDIRGNQGWFSLIKQALYALSKQQDMESFLHLLLAKNPFHVDV